MHSLGSARRAGRAGHLQRLNEHASGSPFTGWGGVRTLRHCGTRPINYVVAQRDRTLSMPPRVPDARLTRGHHDAPLCFDHGPTRSNEQVRSGATQRQQARNISKSHTAQAADARCTDHRGQRKCQRNSNGLKRLNEPSASPWAPSGRSTVSR